MKILWLSSVKLIKGETLASGTWIPGMLDILKNYQPELEIVNITRGNIPSVTKESNNYLTEYMVNVGNEMTDKCISDILNIIKLEKPDVIQVWGTEDIWGIFPFNDLVPNIPAIIEIQGILASVSEEYYGGLSTFELIKCWSIKEFLKPSSSLPAIRRLYTRHVEREAKILRDFKNIGVQSAWSKDVVRTFNKEANLYDSGIALRQAFYESEKWHPEDTKEPRIFSTALMGQPLKGAFILFKAFAIVKQWVPSAKLIMAGVKEDGIRRSGFRRMLEKYAKDHDFWNDVELLGKLDANQLAEEYRKASVFVNPSNWESYSVVTAEAMYIGCPTVAAYAGAMPELGPNGAVAYFPKGDFRICAAEIIRILSDSKHAEEMSLKSVGIASARQNRTRIAMMQIDVYNQLVK